MDSFITYDKTLPIDLDGSTNPDLLTEVTYGEHGFPLMMEKSGTGRMSPVRGRTMKEYDQQLCDLKKENFDLKLRIFFMEEKLHSKFTEEDIIKTNIQLKIEAESYKKDLKEKQELLEKASATIDTLTSEYSQHLEKEVNEMKSEWDDKVQQAKQRTAELENEVKELGDKLKEAAEEGATQKAHMDDQAKQIKDLTENLEGRDREIIDLTDKLREAEQQVEAGQQQEEELKEQLNQLSTNLGRKDRDVHRLSMVVTEKMKVEGLGVLERDHLKDALEDNNRLVEKLEGKCAEQEKDLEEKRIMLGKLEDLLRMKEKEKQSLKINLEEMKVKYLQSKKAVGKLLSDLEASKKECTGLSEALNDLQGQLAAAKRDLNLSEMARQKEAEKVEELEKKLENLARSLGKKEGELETFKDLLDKANKSLRAGEAAVELLNEQIQGLNKQVEQLERERCRCDKKHPKDATDDQKEELMQMQRELNKLRRQLMDQETTNLGKDRELASLMARLNEQDGELNAKRKELNHLRELLDDTESSRKAKCKELDNLKEEWQRREKGYQDKCEELEKMARHINVTMASHMHDADNSDQLQRILDELKLLSKAIQMDKHVHIDINSVLSTQDGGAATKSNSSSSSSTCHTLSPRSQRASHSTSRIPVLHQISHPQSNSDVNLLKQQISDLTQQKNDLEDTLKASEETVRKQTQKLKHYQAMMLDNGSMRLSSLSKSSSDQDVDKLDPTPLNSHSRSHSHSTENLPSCSRQARSMSPTSVAMQSYHGDLGEDLDKLLKENTKLKHQVDGYRRVLRVFQDRDASPDSDDPDLQVDGGPEQISSESASFMLGSWLDMLDGFLTELSQQDQNGHAGQSSTTKVTRLRRGVAQAKGALRSLSGTSIGQQTEGEGRESPDSGCSDNPVSIPNTSLRSPLGSPSHGISPGTSPQDQPQPYTSPGPPHTLVNSPKTQNRCSSGSGADKLAGGRDMCHSGVSSNLINLSDSQCDVGSPRKPDQANYTGDFGTKVNQSCDANDIQPMEKLRNWSMVSDQGEPIGVGSMILGSSMFSTETDIEHVSNKPNMDETPFFSHKPAHIDAKLLEPKSSHRLSDRFYNQTFSASFIHDVTLDGTADLSRISELEPFSRVELDQTSADGTINQSGNDRASVMEMKQRIKSLEEMIETYEEQIRSQCGPNMDSLKHHLLELRHLRIQLEKSLKTNENLERQLSELYKVSECTIQDQKRKIEDLQHQLNRTNDNIREKANIIIEKEHIIKETQITLLKYKDSSEKESADAAKLRGRLEAMDQELNNTKSKCGQLTSACQQLGAACEQYKHRSEQLESDNKKHVAAIERYQIKLQDKKYNDGEVDALRKRVRELESDLRQFHENEEKYKSLLAELRSQVSQLNEDINRNRDTVKEQAEQLDNANLEIELKENTISKQIDELNSMQREIEIGKDNIMKMKIECGARDELIQKLKFTLQQKDEMYDRLDNACKEMNVVNEQLNTRVQKQFQSCEEYKREVVNQQEQIDDMKEELRQASQDRDRLDQALGEMRKELQDTTRMRDKYLYNLKITHKEMSRFKRELREVEKKLNDTSALNNTLQVELNVREKLMKERGDMLTDDDKQNIIAELLNELKSARVQMTKILEQNDSIKRKMIELIHQKEKESQSKGRPATPVNVSQTIHEESYASFSQDVTDSPASFGINHSWPPLRDMASGMAKTDSLSCSLPVREGTLGGPATTDIPVSKPNTPHEGMDSSRVDVSSRMEDKLTTTFGAPTSEDGDKGSYFSVPGPIYKQRVTDQCLLYNVNDSPKYLASLTQVRIDSDLRSLFAVGMIDHFEKLRKEANESNVILKGLACRINERLKVLTQLPATESIEYSTLKELSFSTDHLQVCINSQLSMIGCFWTSELPAPNQKGEFVNQKMIDEISFLREKIQEYEAKLSSRVRSRSAQDEQLCQSLTSTLEVMTQARHNLQQQQKLNSPRSPPRH